MHSQELILIVAAQRLSPRLWTVGASPLESWWWLGYKGPGQVLQIYIKPLLFTLVISFPSFPSACVLFPFVHLIYFPSSRLLLFCKMLPCTFPISFSSIFHFHSLVLFLELSLVFFLFSPVSYFILFRMCLVSFDFQFLSRHASASYILTWICDTLDYQQHGIEDISFNFVFKVIKSSCSELWFSISRSSFSHPPPFC